MYNLLEKSKNFTFDDSFWWLDDDFWVFQWNNGVIVSNANVHSIPFLTIQKHDPSEKKEAIRMSQSRTPAETRNSVSRMKWA